MRCLCPCCVAMGLLRKARQPGGPGGELGALVHRAAEYGSAAMASALRKVAGDEGIFFDATLCSTKYLTARWSGVLGTGERPLAPGGATGGNGCVTQNAEPAAFSFSVRVARGHAAQGEAHE